VQIGVTDSDPHPYLPYQRQPAFDDTTSIEDFLKIIDREQGGDFVEPTDILIFKRERIKNVGLLRKCSETTMRKLDLPGAMEDAIKSLLNPKPDPKETEKPTTPIVTVDDPEKSKLLLLENWTAWWITTKRQALTEQEVLQITKLREEAVEAFAKVKVISNKDLKNAQLVDDSSGLSSVYKAVWNESKVCVKLPRKRITRDEFHEYTVIASIKPHPNVLSLVGVSCDFMLHTSRVCLITPYMAAGSIEKLYRSIGTKLGKLEKVTGGKPKTENKNENKMRKKELKKKK